MRKKSTRFFIILAALWAYTCFKITQFGAVHWLKASVFALALFIMMIGWQFIYRPNPHLLQRRWFQTLAWIGSCTMGLWGTFILLSIPIDIGLLIVHIIGHLSQTKLYAAGNNALLLQKIDFALLGLAGIITILGFIETWRGPKIKQVPIAITHLPNTLSGLKIAQISDLHIGPTIGKRYIEKVVRRTNALTPDLIFITGDLADATTENMIEHLHCLANLKSRLGIYFVTGNHEYYWGAERLINHVKQLGFITLLNENRIININGTAVLIAGVTDPVGAQFVKGHQPDLKKAAHTVEKTHLKILLAHRPDVCFEAEPLGFDLQCSGHTHAGQFFPFNVLIPLAHKYYRRLNQHGRLWVYVNPGTGYWGPANRFGVPAEITLLTLI